MSQSEPVKVETTEVSPALRTLAIEVDAARVDQAFNQSYRELGRSARVKGFRPGKVPKSVLQKMFGASIAEEIERKLISDTLVEAIELTGLVPLAEPDVEAETPEVGSAFRYTARIEVRPAIELPDLSEVKGKRVSVAIEDADVERELENVRQRNSRMVELEPEEEAELGHTANIDFVGRINEVAFEGGTGSDMELELGSGRLVPGFEDQLVGAKAGEDRQVRVTFPDDYGSDDLKGKDAVFDVHIATLRRRDVPELDDELAKDLGDFESLDALRGKLREDMTAHQLERSSEDLRASVLASLIELTDFEVPPGVVEGQLQRQISAMQRQYQGQLPEELLRQQLGRMREEGRGSAEQRVREGFLLGQIAEDQSLSVEDEDVDNRLDELAEAQGIDAAQMRSMAEEQGWRDAIRSELLDQRATDYLISEATIEDVEDAGKESGEDASGDGS